MTESEWRKCGKPELLLQFSHGKLTDRRLRLFAVACCRLIWHQLPDANCRQAVEVTEHFEDGLASPKEMSAAHKAVRVPKRSAMQIGPGVAEWASPSDQQLGIAVAAKAAVRFTSARSAGEAATMVPGGVASTPGG